MKSPCKRRVPSSHLYIRLETGNVRIRVPEFDSISPQANAPKKLARSRHVMTVYG
jgi:hypothetical protein